MAQAIKGRRYRHKKGGRYEVLEFGKDSETCGDVVIYRNLLNGTVWVRPKDEFEDEGRFELMEETEREVLLRMASELDLMGEDLTNAEYGEISDIRDRLFAIGRGE